MGFESVNKIAFHTGEFSFITKENVITLIHKHESGKVDKVLAIHLGAVREVLVVREMFIGALSLAFDDLITKHDEVVAGKRKLIDEEIKTFEIDLSSLKNIED
jgi:hypothetical protein